MCLRSKGENSKSSSLLDGGERLFHLPSRITQEFERAGFP